MHSARGLISLIVVSLVLLCGCSIPDTSPGPSPTVSPAFTAPSVPATVTSSSPGTFSLAVDGVPAGSVLPVQYTCTGSSETPGFSWVNVPEGTRSLVFILDDPDAPSGTFTHWLLYNIPISTAGISPDQANSKILSDGTQVGTNTAGSRGYYPPCPPVGTTHRYVFRLYAVDMTIARPTADRASIDLELDGHTLGETQVTTMFTR